MEHKTYDVLIVGGSYAGLQAALTLARSLRTVLVLDDQQPANKYAPKSHNFLLHDGDDAAHLRAIAREQALAYPTIEILEHTAVFAEKNNKLFTVKDSDGNTFTSRKLLLATGLKDIMPDINGFEECWGKSIVHCPYCHGYEIKDKDLGIMTFPEAAVEFVPLVYNLSSKITLFLDGEPEKKTQNFIADKNIKLVKENIAEALHENGQLHTVVTKEGGAYPLDALFVSLNCSQQNELAIQLGCKICDDRFIDVDVVGQTNIPGLYAAGDCTTPMRAISVAIAAGYKAGIAINNELIEDSLKKD
ncbi:MAG TPA: NAD(P)/FAD-dependent oxidoreductase [Flavipsychrobacter sp.]|nr:NAD(P)/FAD-dependent oxidoreductase [Flavipsychrobacter sp.]